MLPMLSAVRAFASEPTEKKRTTVLQSTIPENSRKSFRTGSELKLLSSTFLWCCLLRYSRL